MIDPSHLAWIDILARLASALAAGAAIGIDREWLHKPAGLKTHMLFSLACAALAVMALEIYGMEQEQGPNGSPDATRIIQGVITGMSFLGAGLIIRGEHRVHGLTTGAGVWLAGALGLIFGSGLYRLGVTTLALGLATLVLGRVIEQREIRTRSAAYRNEKSDSRGDVAR